MAHKILIAASTFSHIRSFHLPYLTRFRELGWEVHVLGGGDPSGISAADRLLPMPFQKSLLSPGNWRTALAAAKLIRRERYDAVLLHTSLAAFFLRIGILLSGFRPKLVINTVHGYLFDRHTPFARRALLIAAEKLTRPVTDLIWVMNQEDLLLARTYRLSRGKLDKIDGMGVDLSRFNPPSAEEKAALRRDLHLPEDGIILIYCAEFSERKNQAFLIRALQRLQTQCPRLFLCLPGDGVLREHCRTLSEALGVSDRVAFPGYQPDTPRWYRAADACVSSSRSEGLPFHLMEAMSCGLPAVASAVKGHTDLIEPGTNGLLFPFGDMDACCTALRRLADSSKLRTSLGDAAHRSVRRYELDRVLPVTMQKFADAWENASANAK